MLAVGWIENGEKGFISQRSVYIHKDRFITSFTKKKPFFERGKTMGGLRKIILCCGLAVLSVGLVGCGKKADENKPISEVKTEAEKMNVEQLRSMAMQYKEAVTAKKAEITKATTKLKEIPITEQLGTEAKKIKADIDNLNKSISALTERFKVYYNKLKEKGGDLSGLEL